MPIEIVDNLEVIQKTYGLADKVPLFALQEYADYLNDIKGVKTIWFVEKVNDSIIFLIPFAIKRKFIITKGYFQTAVNNLANGTIEKEKEFLEEVVFLIRQKKICDWIQQPPNWAVFNSYPNGSVFAPFGSYIINLQDKNIDELFEAIQTKDRSDIRKAIKERVEVKNGFEYLEDALDLIAKTAERANISKPTRLEMNYLRNNIRVFVSYHENIPQTAAIFFVNNYAWYNVFAGSTDKPFRGSNSFLYWSAIKSAKECGTRFFDFVGARINPKPGSKQERIQRFKEHFGVELYKGYLWKMPISDFKYNLYNKIIKTMFVLKGKKYKGDIIDQENNTIINDI